MESGDEDEVTLGERDYQKMERKLFKEGLREGVTKGKDQALQESFDKAYELAYKYGLKFGQFEGLIETTMLLEPETKKVLEPLLMKSMEFDTGFIKTDYPLNQQRMSEVELIWSLKLTELMEEFKSLYPPGSSKIQTLHVQENL